MSKRVRSKSLLKPKKVKRPLSPNNKRNSIPRSCKQSGRTSDLGEYNFDLLSLSTNKVELKLSSNQRNLIDIGKDSLNKKSEHWSSDDELDVVYDVKEEKKNKIYEVITVMSDDETPNKITYERLYADKPEDRIVLSPEAMKKTDLKVSDSVKAVNVEEVVENKNIRDSKVKKETVITKTEYNKESRPSLKEIESDSDDEVVCIAVVDAKQKAEQKKADVEEIFLSSDSDIEITPTVPPLRLKIPAMPNYNNWSVDQFLDSVGGNCSFGTNSASNSYGYGYRSNFMFPYIIGNKKSNHSQPLSDLESSSSSTKVLGLSPENLSPNSSKVFSADESCSSISNYQQNNDNFSSIDNDNVSSSSSSSDEESKIFWKGDRQKRRKNELMYEEFTSYGKKIHKGEVIVDPSNSFIFKVMSYNVLAQNLLEGHRYLYKHHDRRALGWSRRWTLIYDEIKHENPEILCLQEVEESYICTHYAKLHNLGYRFIFKKRTGQYKDGVAIFYKAELFEEEESASVEYHQPGVSVLDRDNVGIIIRLKIKKSPSHSIVVSTTHLLYNPRRSDVKLAQTQMLLAEIDRLAFNKQDFTYHPVILTGDFNLKPHNGVYKLLTEGKMTYMGKSRRNLNTADDSNVVPKTLLPCRLGITDHCQHIEALDARLQGETSPASTKIYHSESNKNPKENPKDDCSLDDRFQSGTLHQSFNFQSVYSHVKEDGQKEASTHHDSWITVDYIFYSSQPGTEGSSLSLLSRVRLPTQDECDRLLCYLPNFAFGSDHLPLVGKFLLKLH